MRQNPPTDAAVEERVVSAWPYFPITSLLVLGLVFVNRVKPVTLAAGMLYVLVPIQLFVSATRAWQEVRRQALT